MPRESFSLTGPEHECFSRAPAARLASISRELRSKTGLVFEAPELSRGLRPRSARQASGCGSGALALRLPCC
eukprot:14352512-Alexandrium_andersonii.AAC.1